MNPHPANFYELQQEAARAQRLTHHAYGAKLTPGKHNLRRLHETEFLDLPQLLACSFAAPGLKAAAVANHPWKIKDRTRDLLGALRYELDRYGCVLLSSNPYSEKQPNKRIFIKSQRKDGKIKVEYVFPISERRFNKI